MRDTHESGERKGLEDQARLYVRQLTISSVSFLYPSIVGNVFSLRDQLKLKQHLNTGDTHLCVDSVQLHVVEVLDCVVSVLGDYALSLLQVPGLLRCHTI